MVELLSVVEVKVLVVVSRDVDEVGSETVSVVVADVVVVVLELPSELLNKTIAFIVRTVLSSTKISLLVPVFFQKPQFHEKSVD